MNHTLRTSTNQNCTLSAVKPENAYLLNCLLFLKATTSYLQLTLNIKLIHCIHEGIGKHLSPSSDKIKKKKLLKNSCKTTKSN